MATLVPAVYCGLWTERERARGCINKESDFFFHLFVFKFLELQYLRSSQSAWRESERSLGLEHDQLAYYEECEGGLDHIGKSRVCGLGRKHCNGGKYAWGSPIQVPMEAAFVIFVSCKFEARLVARSHTSALGGLYPNVQLC